MKRRILTACTALLLGASAWVPSAQAVAFPTIQPYMTDYKIGFTDGTKRVTQPVYDEFSRSLAHTIVIKAGKMGILDSKTGREITPATWDHIELSSTGKIAIVRKGGWFQYLDLVTGKLSATKFAGAHAYYLSPAHDNVFLMVGQKSMLLDSSGKVLIPSFAGKLSVVQLMDPKAAEGGEEKQVRYVLGSAAKQITLFDPVTFAPKFTLKNAELIPNEGGPDTAYLKVRSAGKEGLVDVSGKYALAPNYNALYFWNHGFVRVQGPKGVGLWRNGKMIAEPVHADVGIANPDVYMTMTPDTITYHSIAKGTSHMFKKGAEWMRDRYVLGQDTKTGLYGIQEIGGDVVVPFVYPRVEGPPAAQLLVRSDGKKGLIPSWEQKMAEPAYWFDSYATVGGTYSMLSIQDGKKIGLYSETKGLIVTPEENRVITHDQQRNRILVKAADGTTTAYGFDGNPIQEQETPASERTLTDRLAVAGGHDQGFYLVDRETGQPISQKYRNIYMEGGDIKLIVAMEERVADLYSLQGDLLTKEIRIPLLQSNGEQPPATFTQVDGAVYTAGVQAGSDKKALVEIQNGQLKPVSDFDYRDAMVRITSGHRLIALSRTDGTLDLWAKVNGQMTRILEQASAVMTSEAWDQVLVQKGNGWDLYSPAGQRLSSGNYRSLKFLSTGEGKPGAIVYQDPTTGGYGLMGTNGSILTAPKYEVIATSRDVFPQLWNEGSALPPYLFTTKQQFGYLDQQGQELFQTAFLTKKPTFTYRPLTTQNFLSFTELIRQNPLELIAFDKPYSWPEGVSSEKRFFANLALYLNLPKEAGKDAVLADLIGKGIIKEDAIRSNLRDEDMFALSYFMETGKSSQMTSAELWEWASKRGLVIERGGHNYYQSMDLYAEYHQLFFRELLRSPAGKKAAHPTKLTVTALSMAQQRMLESMINVNGKPLEQLPLLLPREEWTRGMNTIISQYNKQAPQLLADYLKQL